MLIRHWRRCWSRHVLEDRLVSRAKDIRIAAVDLDTAVHTAFDTAVDIPAGVAGSPLLADNWRARYI